MKIQSVNQNLKKIIVDITDNLFVVKKKEKKKKRDRR
jgi:hypothetical protein